tara:strand:- start:468 stop:779 length:312 start_codon:yes stop_codon:yes gene_type:complete
MWETGSLTVLRSEDGRAWACSCREWLGSNVPLGRRRDCDHITRKKAEVVCHLAAKNQVSEDEIILLLVDGRTKGLGLRTRTTGTLTPWARPLSRFASIVEGVT